MARGGNRGTSDGSNRIRFIMLDAELNDGNLNQIAQAITNAVRQVNAAAAPRLLAGPAPAARAGGAADAADAELVEDNFDEKMDTDPIEQDRPPRSTRPRKPPKAPEVISNLDLSGAVSFKDFATEKSPQNDTKRFLTVAAWFKRYKALDAVTVDHVYTCYRTMGWPYGIADYDGVFRQLKKRKLVGRKAKGQYAINQIGEQLVDDLTVE